MVFAVTLVLIWQGRARVPQGGITPAGFVWGLKGKGIGNL